MAIDSILSRTIALDHYLGGVMPELHLKEGEYSVHIKFSITPGDTLAYTRGQACVFRAIRPDGSDLYFVESLQKDDRKAAIYISYRNVAQLAKVPGTYKCTATLLDTAPINVKRQEVLDYNLQAILPFMVIVHQKA